MNNQALAMAEDRAGQEVLRSAEMAEHYNRLKKTSQERKVEGLTMKKWVDAGMPIYTPRNTEPLLFVSMNKICAKEDDHMFDSTGQCSICGSHRAPAR